MSDFTPIPSEELRDRLEDLLSDIDRKIKLIGPLLRELGVARSEVALICSELRSRGELTS